MRKEKRSIFCIAICMLAAFVLWTAAIQFIDVQAIGPQGSTVGFATINRFVHSLTGARMYLYILTDWLSLVPVMFVVGFGVLGLIQWIERKHLLKVDRGLLALGIFYIVVMAVFVLFEMIPVNFRPVLIDGILEASYPSSTTMLVLCVLPTAAMQLNVRIRNIILRKYTALVITVFAVFMVVARFLSGVHWVTDIIGGALLSAGLVLLYRSFWVSEEKH